MRIFVLFVFISVMLGLGIYGAGSALPHKVTTVRGVMLPVVQTDLWKLISDIEGMQKWHKQINSISVASGDDLNNQLWYVRAAEKQEYMLKKTYSLEPDILRWEMLESNMPYSANWSLDLIDKTLKRPDSGVSEIVEFNTFIKITEVSITKNPFSRFFMYYFIGYESVVEQYLQNLADYFYVPDAEIREMVI